MMHRTNLKGLHDGGILSAVQMDPIKKGGCILVMPFTDVYGAYKGLTARRTP